MHAGIVWQYGGGISPHVGHGGAEPVVHGDSLGLAVLRAAHRLTLGADVQPLRPVPRVGLRQHLGDQAHGHCVYFGRRRLGRRGLVDAVDHGRGREGGHVDLDHLGPGVGVGGGTLQRQLLLLGQVATQPLLEVDRKLGKNAELVRVGVSNNQQRWVFL